MLLLNHRRCTEQWRMMSQMYFEITYAISELHAQVRRVETRPRREETQAEDPPFENNERRMEKVETSPNLALARRDMITTT
jgi:hypothetical protein